MEPDQYDKLVVAYREGLLRNTLPFWLEHGVDRQYGGFMTSLDRAGHVIDTDKGVWQQARFTWLLGELYNQIETRDEWLQLAKHGAKFLDAHCADPIDGRMWFTVTREGQPLRKRRYAFTESFAAIAYGELFRATAEPHYAEKAKRAFRRFVDHNENPQDTQPKFTDIRKTREISFPMILIATAQELRESIRLRDADNWIDRGISDICRFHLKQDIQCVMETVTTSGGLIDHFHGRTLNPGHAIEGAWFIMREGEMRADHALIRTGCQMLDWMWQRGWDQQFGGILYFVDVHGLPVQEYWHDMKFWWPQNEATVATLLAYHLTGEPKYERWHRMIHDWSHSLFPDALHGEWFGYLHRDGRIGSTLKGNHWKGPFHLPRMQLTCWQILSRMADRSRGDRGRAGDA